MYLNFFLVISLNREKMEDKTQLFEKLRYKMFKDMRDLLVVTNKKLEDVKYSLKLIQDFIEKEAYTILE